MITVRKHAIKITLALIVLVVSFSAILYFFDARILIESIGVRNSYLLIFFIALVGGVSSFTTGSYLATLYLFANEGLSIWLLGMAGGLAIFIGDYIFFQLGKHGYQALEGSDSEWLHKFKYWVDRRSARSLQLFSYFYSGFTPLPNDLLTLPLGASHYSFRYFVLPLLVGSIQLQTITAFLFSLGWFSNLAN